VWDGVPAAPYHWITLYLMPSAAGLEIRIRAPFYGDPLPPDTAPGPVDGLWEHEVVELFVSGSDDRYTEIELSPSGHHLVLQFAGVRRPVARLLDIKFTAKVEGDQWTGTAQIPAPLLPPKPWRINATAIHGSGAERVYLSWVALPGAAPDFHQPALFRPIDD
jgi:hypothetical protein